MKVLSALNVSNPDNMHCDSGHIFQRILAEELTAQGHSFVLVGPVPLSTTGARHVRHLFGHNKFEVRFNFDWKGIHSLIEAEKPDLLLVNQLELAPHFRSVVASASFSRVPIVSYAHYVPFATDRTDTIVIDPSLDNIGLGQSIVLSFLAGIVASDLVFVHSNYALKLISQALIKHGLRSAISKLQILPPPRDPILCGTPLPKTDPPRLIYNHRLYEHYGTGFVVDLLNELVNEFNIDVHVMDPIGERSAARKALDPSVDHYRTTLKSINRVFVRDDGKDRTRYRDVLEASFVGLAPYRNGCVWSMSCVDCLGMGIPVVAPNFGCFPELVPSELLYESQEQAVSIIGSLLEDQDRWNVLSEQSRAMTTRLEPRLVVKSFLSELARL